MTDIREKGMLGCPYLRYYESYKPKRYKYADRERIGKRARIPIFPNPARAKTKGWR